MGWVIHRVSRCPQVGSREMRWPGSVRHSGTHDIRLAISGTPGKRAKRRADTSVRREAAALAPLPRRPPAPSRARRVIPAEGALPTAASASGPDPAVGRGVARLRRLPAGRFRDRSNPAGRHFPPDVQGDQGARVRATATTSPHQRHSLRTGRSLRGRAGQVRLADGRAARAGRRTALRRLRPPRSDRGGGVARRATRSVPGT